MRRTSLLAVLAAVLVARVQSQKYFITVSKYVRPKLNYEIDVSLDSSINSDVTIKARVTGTTSYRNPSKEIAVGQVTISPPKLKETLTLMMGKLSGDYYQVWLTLEGSGGITFNETKALQVEKKTLSIFIQTDKAIYKPGQTVRARVMAVDDELKPSNKSMKIEVFDSKSNKIKSMQNLLNPPFYVNAFNITLSTQPNLGMWKIVAEVEGQKVEQEVEVAEYVLPKFDVTIECPKYKIFDEKDLKCAVVAKYTFGKMLEEANATVYIDLDYYSSSYYGVKRGMLVKKFTLKEGRAEFSLSEFEILDMKFDPDYCVPRRFREETRQCHIDAFRGDGNYMPTTTIKMMANVTNKLTGTTLSGDVAVKIESSTTKIMFLSMTPGNFKPLQSYLGVVKISQINDDPLDESFLPLKMSVRAEITTKSEVKYQSGPRWTLDIGTFDVDVSGIVPFQFTVPENATAFNLVANSTDPKTKSKSKKSVTAWKYNINVFESGSNTTMQIQMPESTGTVQPDTDQGFLLLSSKAIPDGTSFYYTILAKGSVAASGQFTAADTQIPMEDDSPLYRYEFTIRFTTELAQKASPAARIIVHFLTESGKLIVDTIDFNVEGGIANKVSCQFSTNQTEPGENLQVSVAAAPNSQIFLLGVDQSVLNLATGNDIDWDDVISQLKMYDPSQRYITPYPMFWGGFRKRRSSYRWWWPPTTGGDDTAEVLDRAGLLVFTDAYIHEKEEDYTRYEYAYDADAEFGMDGSAGVMEMSPARSNEQIVPMVGVVTTEEKKSQPPPKIREEFPETWIWMDTQSG